MTAVWTGLAITAALAVFCAGLVLAFYLWDTAGRPVWSAVVAFLTVAGGIIALTAALERSDGDGVHRWDGGAGPNTRCHYEVDQRVVPAGKVMVPVDQVQTVCVDGASR